MLADLRASVDDDVAVCDHQPRPGFDLVADVDAEDRTREQIAGTRQQRHPRGEEPELQPIQRDRKPALGERDEEPASHACGAVRQRRAIGDRRERQHGVGIEVLVDASVGHGAPGCFQTEMIMSASWGRWRATRSKPRQIAEASGSGMRLSALP